MKLALTHRAQFYEIDEDEEAARDNLYEMIRCMKQPKHQSCLLVCLIVWIFSVSLMIPVEWDGVNLRALVVYQFCVRKVLPCSERTESPKARHQHSLIGLLQHQDLQIQLLLPVSHASVLSFTIRKALLSYLAKDQLKSNSLTTYRYPAPIVDMGVSLYLHRLTHNHDADDANTHQGEGSAAFRLMLNLSAASSG